MKVVLPVGIAVMLCWFPGRSDEDIGVEAVINRAVAHNFNINIINNLRYL